MRLLLIEDDAELQRLIHERLEQEGFSAQGSGDGQEGLYLAREFPFDLAIVDLGLPGLGGLTVIERLRAQGKALPILILTARGRWEDKVKGLEAGADDYLVKPFHMEELVARVRVLLRRAAGGAANILHVGPLDLDLSRQVVSMHGHTLALSAYEYRLLEYLVRHAGRVISKAELADYLYPHDEDPDSNVIEVLIGRLRRKLDPDSELRPIATLRGRGYRFELGP